MLRKPLSCLFGLIVCRNSSESSFFQKNPLLIRVDTKAGHGFGKPTSKIVSEMLRVVLIIFLRK